MNALDDITTELSLLSIAETSRTLTVRQAEVLALFLYEYETPSANDALKLSARDADVARGGLHSAGLVKKVGKGTTWALTVAGARHLNDARVVVERNYPVPTKAKARTKAPAHDAPKQAHTSHADCAHGITPKDRARCRAERKAAAKG